MNLSIEPIRRPFFSFSASPRSTSLALGAFFPRREAASFSIFCARNAGFSGMTSTQGASVTWGMDSVRRWLSMSKLERESTSSPQNSTRTGALALGEKKSTMPPRWLNCPGPSIWSSRV